MNPTDLAIAKSDVEKLANISRILIQAVAGILALVFAFVVISQPQIITILNQSDPGIIYKVGLFLYYTSWVFGAKFDVDIEEKVYIQDGERGIIDWKAFGILAIFTIVMLLFFWLHTKERYFSLGLMLFIFVNFIGWKTVCRRIKGTIDESANLLEGTRDFFGLTKLQMVSDYMRGRWQLLRFMTMGALAILQIALTTVLAYTGVGEMIGGFNFQGVEIQGKQLVALAPAIFFLMYVLVAEGWMWIQRMNVHHSVNILDQLAADFRLERKPARRETAT